MALLQPPLRRVTSTDVARAVGLSRTTVSYVLNDTPGQKIPENTRRRVLDAAASLGYAPSAAARTLRSGRYRISAVRPARHGSRPDGGGRAEHHPGRRVGVVDVGAAGG